MAPEMPAAESGRRRAGHFLLGIVFYESLTGRHPFAAIVSRHFRPHPAAKRLRQPLVQSGCVPALESILQCMLAKKASDRYPSARSCWPIFDHLQSGINPGPPAAITSGAAKKGERSQGLRHRGFGRGSVGSPTQVPRIRQLGILRPNPAVIRLVVLPCILLSAVLNDRCVLRRSYRGLALWLGQFGDRGALRRVPPSEVEPSRWQNVEQARKKFMPIGWWRGLSGNRRSGQGHLHPVEQRPEGLRRQHHPLSAIPIG